MWTDGQQWTRFSRARQDASENELKALEGEIENMVVGENDVSSTTYAIGQLLEDECYVINLSDEEL